MIWGRKKDFKILVPLEITPTYLPFESSIQEGIFADLGIVPIGTLKDIYECLVEYNNNYTAFSPQGDQMVSNYRKAMV